MSFFQRAELLISEGGLFEGTPELSMLVLVHSFEQQSNLRRDSNNNPTSLTMRREAEQSFCNHYDISAAQYSGLSGLCDNGGGLGDVYAAYRGSLPQNVQGVPPDFVQRSVMYDGVCSTESCEGNAMRVSHVNATFYDVDECYPIRHYVKKCRGGCGASYFLNKKRQRGPDGSTWHTFFPWTEGVPLEISNKSGKSVLSVAFLTHIALTLSRMR